MTERKAGILVLAIHLALIGLVLAKYAFDLARLPRAWSEVQWDVTPQGRYLTMRACPAYPANMGNFVFPVHLRAVNGFLVADPGTGSDRVKMARQPGNKVCLAMPGYWHFPETTPTPAAGKDLWVEYLVPENDWPRPLRLGTKQNGRIQELTR